MKRYSYLKHVGRVRAPRVLSTRTRPKGHERGRGGRGLQLRLKEEVRRRLTVQRNNVPKVAGTLRVPSAEPLKALLFEGYGTWNVPTTLLHWTVLRLNDGSRGEITGNLKQGTISPYWANPYRSNLLGYFYPNSALVSPAIRTEPSRCSLANPG